MTLQLLEFLIMHFLGKIWAIPTLWVWCCSFSFLVVTVTLDENSEDSCGKTLSSFIYQMGQGGFAIISQWCNSIQNINCNIGPLPTELFTAPLKHYLL